MLAHAQSNLSGSPDLILASRNTTGGIRACVGEQIRLAYNETLHDPRNAEVVGRLGMILAVLPKI